MTSIKNKACTLKVGQIEKNPILALSTGEKEVEKYARVTKSYGSVTAAVVGHNGSAYRVLSGQAGLEACANNGIREMPVIVAELNDDAEQMKLALLLSTVREEGGPLSEGAFIDALITCHGVTRRELMALLKKSKSWISKRQSLALRLSEDVKEMVKDGIICARAAEEISRLPDEVQFAFAGKVARDGLSKTNVGQLVSLYTKEETGSAVRAAIMETPLAVLDAYPTSGIARQKEKRGLAERISGNIAFIFRLSYELKGLLAAADAECIAKVSTHLNELRLALSDISSVIDRVARGVYPGKPQGGGAP